MGSHQKPLESRHAEALRVGQVGGCGPGQGTRVTSGMSLWVMSASLETIAACVRSSVVGYFRRLGPTHALRGTVNYQGF
jgi:hypothetical protein